MYCLHDLPVVIPKAVGCLSSQAPMAFYMRSLEAVGGAC